MATAAVTVAPTSTFSPQERLSTLMLLWWFCTTLRSSSRDTTRAITMMSNGEKHQALKQTKSLIFMGIEGKPNYRTCIH